MHKRCRHPIKNINLFKKKSKILSFYPEERPRSQNNAFSKVIAKYNQ
jgi:hypothetical protein